MKLIKCPKNHFYDGDKYQTCPHCSGEISSTGKPAGTLAGSTASGSQTPVASVPIESETTREPMSLTMPLFGGALPQSVQKLQESEEPSTLPEPEIQSDSSESEATPARPVSEESPASPQHSIQSEPEQVILQEAQPTSDQIIRQETPPASNSLAAAVSASAHYNIPGDTGKTVGFYDFGGDEPVVGWLVCVKGVHHGESFQLKSGHNAIGRDLKMDIALTNDKSVSRNRHALVIYDPKNIKFYIQQGESALAYLDGAPVLAATQMEPRCIIGLGDGEYLFVPLCGDGFSWEEHK